MIREVRMPKYPECWETCGDCGSGDIVVQEVHVSPGDPIRADDNLITLETGKVALDIPAPIGGHIVEMLVAEGDTLAEGQVIATIEATD
jgi:pyruvate/2-oxoglutarate dehydrogenase complex dihydrolipoamide acyltransferase (E2) component